MTDAQLAQAKMTGMRVSETKAQLRAMRRIGRPPLGAAARRLIAIRIDPAVLAAVRSDAKRRGLRYQSLINDVLAKYVARSRSA